jgi:hypothetical protein
MKHLYCAIRRDEACSPTVRRVIKRGTFTFIADLKQKVLDLIVYFNRTLAKPF